MKKNNTNRAIKILIFALIVAILFLVTLIVNFIGLKDSVDSVVNPSSTVSINTSSDDEKTKSDIAEENNTVIEPTLMSINAMPLKMLTNNSWNRIKANLTENYEIQENGKYVYEEGYTLYCDEINVKNIVFNTNYKGEIVGKITLGTDFKDIKSTLGTPTFEDKSLEMIGYKTKDLYVFFYKNEVSIYSNKSVNNRNFENELFNYYYGNYTGGRTRFIVDIKREYPDFTAIQDDSNVILRSINRQIEIKLSESGETEITIYNGYKPGTIMSNILEQDNDIISRQQDLAEKQEIERKLAE